MWSRRIVLIALAIALVAPLFIAGIPPLLDYPVTGHLLPQTLAEKALIALALLLPVLGTVALHDAIFARRSWWPWAAALIAYTAALIAGDLEWLIGAGLALFGAACWVRLRQNAWQQWLTYAAIAVPYCFIHFAGTGFSFAMIAAFELSEAWRERQAARLAMRAVKLGLAALPVAALYFQTQLAGGADPLPLHAVKTVWWAINKLDPFAKAIGAGAEFFTYDSGIDLLIMIAVAAALGFLALARKLAFSWLTLLGVALYLVYPFLPLPDAAPGAIDIRLPVLAGFLLFGGIMPRKLGRRETAVLGLAFAALIAARLGVIANAWQGQNGDLAANDFVVAAAQAPDRPPVLLNPGPSAP